MDLHNVTVIIQADGSAVSYCAECEADITIPAATLRGSPLSLAPEHPLTLPCPGPALPTWQVDPNMAITIPAATLRGSPLSLATVHRVHDIMDRFVQSNHTADEWRALLAEVNDILDSLAPGITVMENAALSELVRRVNDAGEEEA